ncbi:uncharacterized protein LOC135824855 [Sycon ciliatum]|uniref:uncharacterized protein LOC135824855 n=1 Tax=Sycon ciliatum TaxID=27933 RepID=UPI0031F6DAFB
MEESVLVDKCLSLRKVIVERGSGVQCPVEGTNVAVRIQQRQNDRIVQFEVGSGDTLLDDYLDSLVLTMKYEEVSICSFPSSCFTEGSSRPDKELVEVTVSLDRMPESTSPVADLPSPGQRLVLAKQLKDRGGQLVSTSSWWLAARRYSRAAKHCILGLTVQDLDRALQEELIDIRAKCHLNLAACQLRMGDAVKVVKNCTYVLDMQPDNVKALYRRGRALSAVKEYERAEADFKHALQCDPQNRQVVNAYDDLKACMKKQDTYYHNALKSMFGGT